MEASLTAGAGNTAGTAGGGIFNAATGTLTLIDSTGSGNTAGTEGGGIFNDGGGLDITNSTISGDPP